MNKRISELSHSVHSQLQNLNESLLKQEDAIKKSIKKSEDSRVKKSTSNTILRSLSPKPPSVPPPPKEYTGKLRFSHYSRYSLTELLSRFEAFFRKLFK